MHIATAIMPQLTVHMQLYDFNDYINTVRLPLMMILLCHAAVLLYLTTVLNIMRFSLMRNLVPQVGMITSDQEVNKLTDNKLMTFIGLH